MEFFRGVREDPVVCEFLKKFPEKDWAAVITKTLRFGIYSTATYESLCNSETSPVRTIKLNGKTIGIQLSPSKANNNLDLVEKIRTAQENYGIVKSESKNLERKKKGQVRKTTEKRTTPRSSRSGFDNLLKKKSFSKLCSWSKTVEKPYNKPSNSSLKLENYGKVPEKRAENHYIQSFNSLTNKLLEAYISPKAQTKTPSNEISAIIKPRLRNINQSLPSRIHRSAHSNIKKFEEFTYITSSSDSSA